MAKLTEDGGPAFPASIAVGPSGDLYEGVHGMTKREYFAAQALTGTARSLPHEPGPEGLAKRAVAIADALIAALSPSPAAQDREDGR